MSKHIEFYKKKIYAVENIAGYVLEIGNFHLGYSTKAGVVKYYNGKYMTMWKRDDSGRLKIISEAFGSDKYIKPEDMPYATVEVKKTVNPMKTSSAKSCFPKSRNSTKASLKPY